MAAMLNEGDADFVAAGLYPGVPGHPRQVPSNGEYVMVRPVRGPLNPTGVDEGTDAYDTIDWLVKNVPEIERPRRRDRVEL